MKLRRDDGTEFEVPFADIQAVCLSHPRTSVSVRTLSELGSHGVSVVIGDAAHRPSALVLPLATHGRIGARFSAQAALSKPSRKRFWRQIVRSKIRAQAGALAAATGSDAGLAEMCKAVRSGDSTNVEAQAAVRYWRRIFSDDTFRRDPSAGGRNSMLNYGYAIVRASMARAICGAGLHPALGLHHHNRENPLCLADDLMEPFRPLVDLAVAWLCPTDPGGVELTPQLKAQILTALTRPVMDHDELRTCFELQERMAFGLAKVIEGKSDRLWLPRMQLERRQ